jgi:LmbE family N-acetylglucosaminyl deacetylase
MQINPRHALVLSPHTDDSIIGAGALLYKLAQQGCEIEYHVFTKCDDTLIGTKYQKGEIAREDKAAAKTLGVKKCIYHDFVNKHLPDSRQEILDIIYEHRKDPDLDLIIAPYSGDLHQDHKAVAEEALRAATRHRVTLVQYRIEGTSRDFNPNIYVPLTEEEVNVKMKALSCYKTQFDLRDQWFSIENFKAIMRTDGIYINKEFAEAFILVRGTWLFE